MSQVFTLNPSECSFAGGIPDTGLFDWSRGPNHRNSNTVTMYGIEPIVLEPSSSKQFLDDAELSRKVVLLINLSHACKMRVPELLAREAALLSTADFARLMMALEKNSEYSFEDERFYVFRYSDGVIGSVWLYGEEVYSCPR